MLRSALSKAMWVGRTTASVIGLAIALALVFGVATMAFAANGQNFVLGVLTNSATAVTKLTANVSGKPALQVVNPNTGAGSHALQLITATGKPPIVVNQSAGKATNLNADKLDGKDSTEIGVNGLEYVTAGSSSVDSSSPKNAQVSCSSGKVVVGTGFDISGGKTGSSPDMLTNVVIDEVAPFSSGVVVQAYEEEPTNADWGVFAHAICAKAGTP